MVIQVKATWGSMKQTVFSQNHRFNCERPSHDGFESAIQDTSFFQVSPFSRVSSGVFVLRTGGCKGFTTTMVEFIFSFFDQF